MSEGLERVRHPCLAALTVDTSLSNNSVQLDRRWGLGWWEGLEDSPATRIPPLSAHIKGNNGAQLLGTYYVQAFYLHRIYK